MVEYRHKLDDILLNFRRAEQLQEEALAIKSERANSPIIYSKLEESKKCNKKAVNDLEKIIGSLGFKLDFKIKSDSDFLKAYQAISRRVDAALEALYDFTERFSCLTII